MNTINLIGRLTADPELKTTNAGTSVTSFTLAVDRPFAKDVTDFVPCVAWRKSAEFICQYFTRGRRMGISGTLQSRKYEDRDGNKRTAWEVVVDQVDFCDSKPGSAKPAEEWQIVDDEEDLPF